MAFGSLEAGDDNEPLAEINMVPLIDVMLVLLIIFIVAAPLLTHAVKLDLPKASSAPNQTKPDNVQISIDADSRIFWNSQEVSRAELSARLALEAARTPQPELHLRADHAAPYGRVAEVMAESARHGLSKIGFVTDPRSEP
jgi:biopolymer transport protein ExbD